MRASIVDGLWPSQTNTPTLAGAAWRILFALTAANAIFNVLAVALGATGPLASFLPGPDDLFADFFKFVLSYPGGDRVPVGNATALRDLLARYVADNPYHGVDGLGRGVVTHLHVPPFTTLLSLAALRAMRVLDPVWLFGLLVAGLAVWSAFIARAVSTSRREAVTWTAFLLLSYPTLLVVTRGNLFAGLTALLLVHAVLVVARGGSAAAAALLLALAINVRPNAAIFALVLFAAAPGTRLRTGMLLAGATAILFAASLAAASALYPDYTLVTFLAGLAQYHQVYVVGGLGLPYGSSLYGGLKLLLGHRPGLEAVAALAAAALAAAAITLRIRAALPMPVFAFLLAAAYCLGSSVFADYHLLVFAAPVLCFALARPNPRDGTDVGHDGRLVVVASCALLAPKNYVFAGPVSEQVLLNPLILVAAAGALVFSHARSLAASSRGDEADRLALSG